MLTEIGMKTVNSRRFLTPSSPLKLAVVPEAEVKKKRERSTTTRFRVPCAHGSERNVGRGRMFYLAWQLMWLPVLQPLSRLTPARGTANNTKGVLRATQHIVIR